MEFHLYQWVVDGEALIRQVQQLRSPWLDAYFRFATFLGNEEFFLLFMPLLYWCIHKAFGRRLAYLLMLSTYVNTFVKGLFRLPRPPQELRLVAQEGYGLPSGHAMNAVSVWGYTAHRWRQWGWVRWLLAGLLILSIGFSRIYLGVHYPADVLAGWLLGLLLLLAWIRVEPRLATWASQRTPVQVLGFSLLLALAMLFLHPGDAQGYPSRAAGTIAGVLLGLNVGFFYEPRRVDFQVAGSGLQRLGRLLVGGGVTLVFYLGLRVLFGLLPVDPTTAALLRMVRYAFTGCAVAWWGPAAFVRLGLAQGKGGASLPTISAPVPEEEAL